MSNNVVIKSLNGTVVIKNPKIGAIRFGYGYVGIIDEQRERFLWENSGTVVFDAHARLNVGTRVVCMAGGSLEFGESFVVNGRSSFICGNKMKFGNDVLISWDCLFMDTDFHEIYDTNTDEKLNDKKSIVVGDHVWFGCRCLCIKGTEIPSDCVIAAGSKIAKKLQLPNTIYVDHLPVREGINWK